MRLGSGDTPGDAVVGAISTVISETEQRSVPGGENADGGANRRGVRLHIRVKRVCLGRSGGFADHLSR